MENRQLRPLAEYNEVVLTNDDGEEVGIDTVGFSQRLRSIIGRGQVEEAARVTGVNISSLRKYLAGEVEPGMRQLVSIAQGLDVSLDWLMAGRGVSASGVVMRTPIDDPSSKDDAIFRRLYNICREANDIVPVEVLHNASLMDYLQIHMVTNDETPYLHCGKYSTTAMLYGEDFARNIAGLLGVPDDEFERAFNGDYVDAVMPMNKSRILCEHIVAPIDIWGQQRVIRYRRCVFPMQIGGFIAAGLLTRFEGQTSQSA